jgi:hypothetical protein
MVLSGVNEEVVLLHRREATEGGGHDQLPRLYAPNSSVDYATIVGSNRSGT